MRVAMQLPGRKGTTAANSNDRDPRDGMSAEIIDLASRNAFPIVARKSTRSDALGLVAGVAIVALLGAVTLWSMDTARVASQSADVNTSAPAQQPASPAALAPAQTPQDSKPKPQVAAPAPAADPAPQAVLANPPQTSLTPAANPNANPTIVFDASVLPSPTDPVAAGEAGKQGNSASDFASRIGGVGGATAQATAMVDPSTTVTQGTLIPAILETAIDTNVPGYVRAVVSRDVRSFDGSRVLVPRSSRLIGQYQSGLQGGQKRAYVIWTRLIRPDGASVALASPATDFAGNTGLPGKVNSHFFKRFGSAMLLSVIGGLSTIASGGSSLVLGGGQSAAAAAVQQDSQIGPTVRVRQGEPIRVFTARDLDFSRVASQ